VERAASFGLCEGKGDAAYALADLLSRRGLERPCENLVAWAREGVDPSAQPRQMPRCGVRAQGTRLTRSQSSETLSA
jgi:hypothetical protein